VERLPESPVGQISPFAHKTTTCAKRDQRRESRSQKARSRWRRRGRLELRRNTASCWRRASFSMTRSARGRKPARSARRALRMRASIASSMHEAGAGRYPRRCSARWQLSPTGI
jgi:hypothetical protein